VAVSIDVSFQYSIIADELPQMYTEQGALYSQNIVRIARFVLRDVASNYTATQFFTKRVEIGQVMLSLLQSELRPLHFQAVFFQLRDILLPTVFESAIETAEVARQTIQITQFQQAAARVRQVSALGSFCFAFGFLVLTSAERKPMFAWPTPRQRFRL
jgi:regulator of protease activity HflC (stomatin/prohibitin superfamily)